MSFGSAADRHAYVRDESLFSVIKEDREIIVSLSTVERLADFLIAVLGNRFGISNGLVVVTTGRL
jgi:hypothetical protein